MTFPEGLPAGSAEGRQCWEAPGRVHGRSRSIFPSLPAPGPSLARSVFFGLLRSPEDPLLQQPPLLGLNGTNLLPVCHWSSVPSQLSRHPGIEAPVLSPSGLHSFSDWT